MPIPAIVFLCGIPVFLVFFYASLFSDLIANTPDLATDKYIITGHDPKKWVREQRVTSILFAVLFTIMWPIGVIAVGFATKFWKNGIGFSVERLLKKENKGE